jgi:hypothetical protein
VCLRLKRVGPEVDFLSSIPGSPLPPFRFRPATARARLAARLDRYFLSAKLFIPTVPKGLRFGTQVKHLSYQLANERMKA